MILIIHDACVPVLELPGWQLQHQNKRQLLLGGNMTTAQDAAGALRCCSISLVAPVLQLQLGQLVLGPNNWHLGRRR